MPNPQKLPQTDLSPEAQASRVFMGDCTQVLTQLDDSSVDCFPKLKDGSWAFIFTNWQRSEPEQ
jgi:hypothetical protein